MYQRLINITLLKSFFLFGARGTGKSTWLQKILPLENTLVFDLLDADLEDRLQRDPSLFSSTLLANERSKEWVLIDEIQKVPYLLDEVHRFIERKKLKFALSGSSARKLKRGGANLLAGRALLNHLFPLTHRELGEDFDLSTAIHWGGLPAVINTTDNDIRKQMLRTYALTYLNEEIKAEQIVRNLNPFRKFLEVAAQMNGEPVNFSKVARDVGSDYKTVQNYYQILEDTLMGFFLEPYHPSVRKRQKHAPKFYFFDIGVTRALRNVLNEITEPGSYGYGKVFEHFLILEIFRLNDYLRKDFQFSFLRLNEQREIDLIIKRPGEKLALVEIKSTREIRRDHVAGVEYFLDIFKGSEGFCLSQDPIARRIGRVECLNWIDGIKRIGLNSH
ncbi:MAG: AAA family ATPase [Bdellovibrionota bacterium]